MMRVSKVNRAAWRASVCSLALLATLGAGQASAAEAADGRRVEIAQADAERTFDIPAQPLAEALIQFGRQAGRQATADMSAIADLTSAPVKGVMTWDAALVKLLSGTGLTYTVNGSMIAVQRPGDGATVLDPISVEGRAIPSQVEIGNLTEPYAGGQVARGGRLGVLGTRDIMDTPFNQTTYTSQLIEDQQAATLADVLANDPSVRTNIRGRGTNNGGGDQFYIRGFALANDEVSLNGLYGALPDGTVPMEMVERVEVLKGPNALLNGMAPGGNVGGGINIVAKRATDDPTTRLTTSYGNDMQGGAHLDLGRRFGANKEFGVRFNGSYRNGDTAIDKQRNEVRVATIALDYRGDDFRLTTDLGYQYDETDIPSSWGGGLRLRNTVTDIPDAPDANKRTAQLWEYTKNEDTFASVSGEYDILSSVTAYAAAGTRNYQLENLRTVAYLNSNDGALLLLPTNYPQYSNTNSVQGGLRGAFDLAGVRHEWNLGASKLFSEDGYGYNQFTTQNSDLYDIVDIARPSSAGFHTATKSSETELSSAVLADTLVFGDDLAWLSLGVRYQRVEHDTFNVPSGASASSYDEEAVTPAIGLVVKPTESVSLYANYIEGLTRGTVSSAGNENAGEVFPPTKTKQVEGGVKVDFGETGATLSVFQITQPNGITQTGSTAGSTVYTIDGEQRSRGVELTAFGKLFDDYRILGGVTLMEAQQVKTANGTNDGNNVIGAPKWMANLGLEWDAPSVEGLTLSARTLLTGAQSANASNDLEIPMWGRLDLGARYSLENYPVEFRASIQNVLDASYWESVASSQGLRIGAPRTFQLSMSIDF